MIIILGIVVIIIGAIIYIIAGAIREISDLIDTEGDYGFTDRR